MRVIVNGELMQFEEGATAADVVTAVKGDPSGRGTAVALNGEVVTRSRWAKTEISEEDRIEIVTAVQGG